jgi:hypothetical protein
MAQFVIFAASTIWAIGSFLNVMEKRMQGNGAVVLAVALAYQRRNIMNIISEHNALHLIDISDDDTEHLLQILRAHRMCNFTKRWSGVDGNDEAVKAARRLLEQLKENINV